MRCGLNWIRCSRVRRRAHAPWISISRSGGSPASMPCNSRACWRRTGRPRHGDASRSTPRCGESKTGSTGSARPAVSRSGGERSTTAPTVYQPSVAPLTNEGAKNSTPIAPASVPSRSTARTDRREPSKSTPNDHPAMGISLSRRTWWSTDPPGEPWMSVEVSRRFRLSTKLTEPGILAGAKAVPEFSTKIASTPAVNSGRSSGVEDPTNPPRACIFTLSSTFPTPAGITSVIGGVMSMTTPIVRLPTRLS